MYKKTVVDDIMKKLNSKNYINDRKVAGKVGAININQTGTTYNPVTTAGY